MRELPILFSGAMVRAILDGRKTQTRRIIGGTALDWLTGAKFDPAYVALPENRLSPYGYAGDRLWVREAWRTISDLNEHSGSRIAELCLDAGYMKPWAPIQYEADGRRANWEHTSTPSHDREPQPGRYRHARFMPRWASRVTLEVSGARVERLQDIIEDDAVAEGCYPREINPIAWYVELWDSLNAVGGYGWNANPWVWVVEFREIEP